MSSSIFTDGLNPEQVEAALHNHGPLLILAGAGAGKTTVLVSRTGRLIADRVAKADEILFLTFTNKAARELKERVEKKLGKSAKGLWAGTFHSFGLRLLKTYHEKLGLSKHFGVLDQGDAQAVLRELLKNLSIPGKDKFDLDRLLNLINQVRVEGKIKSAETDEYATAATALAEKYERRLKALDAVDFEDLLLKPIELLKKNPDIQAHLHQKYQQLMVDEFQDTNHLQMKFIELILGPHQNISVVGDDDQSIYGWRGAQIANILNFPKLFKNCKEVRLERNYRSVPEILNLANAVIANNKQRHGKILKPSKSAGQSALLPEVFKLGNEEEEPEFVIRELRKLLSDGYKAQEIAILYRSNSQGGNLEANLRRERIPYVISGGTSFFDRKEVKDALSFVRCMFAPQDMALRRIINVPARGIGDQGLESLNAWAKMHNTSFYKGCLSYNGPERWVNELKTLFAHFRENKEKILARQEPISETILRFFQTVGYRLYIHQSSKDAEAAIRRWSWVEILARIIESSVQKNMGKMSAEDAIENFLESMDLRDQTEEDESDSIRLMTLHASKGLEFPVVFLLGVEEDLLPHRTLGSDVDEERRLFYVGVTRAEKKLILTYCTQRKRHGVLRPVSPSRFLIEIPQNLVAKFDSPFRPVTHAERENLVADFLSKFKVNNPPST